MVFDTDVLVWALRRNLKAAAVIDTVQERHVSVVTHMELLRGARNKAELQSIKKEVSALRFAVLPLTENIGHRASMYLELHVLKSGLSVSDALIAATAVENGLTLCTGNVKHYKVIADLEIKAFRP